MELAGDVIDVDAGADDADAGFEREEPEEWREDALTDPVLGRRCGSDIPKDARLSR